MAGDEERPAVAVRSARERIMALRAPSMDEGLGLEALTGKACSCRKPKGIEFFRIRPGEDWTLQLCLYVEKAGDAIPDGFYAIAPPLAKYLPAQRCTTSGTASRRTAPRSCCRSRGRLLG